MAGDFAIDKYGRMRWFAGPSGVILDDMYLPFEFTLSMHNEEQETIAVVGFRATYKSDVSTPVRVSLWAPPDLSKRAFAIAEYRRLYEDINPEAAKRGQKNKPGPKGHWPYNKAWERLLSHPEFGLIEHGNFDDVLLSVCFRDVLEQYYEDLDGEFMRLNSQPLMEKDKTTFRDTFRRSLKKKWDTRKTQTE